MVNEIATQFLDSPGLDQLAAAVSLWQRPVLPQRLELLGGKPEERAFWERSVRLKDKLKSINNIRTRGRLEKSLIDWLYELIRLNIKRGRIFKLKDVLDTGKADCLGYAKLFTTLGRRCGLDLGIVEIVVDNRDMNVPHTATLVRIADGGRQTVDFWYGSTHIRHKRLGMNVKRGNKWQIEDIDYESIKEAEDVSYLPDYTVDAITLYIEGNRSLKTGDNAGAVERYSHAIRLYPLNSRIFYNRAIAYEHLGFPGKAQEDYARALLDESSTSRTLATQPEDIEDLIRLDEAKLPEVDQQVFLLRNGFITGRNLSPSKIAQKLGLSRLKVKYVLENIRQIEIRAK